ncbi:hypothetical protein Tsubulata_017002 [Turnera subulata]|uniref:Uncharacterized protein n=1 Tax=Turnera subulata TaxID=218843 RepID=A0A9Q0FI17_9ROSI|nr:hypothetical protein Tsubulata_017002 [Turnera subulata]
MSTPLLRYSIRERPVFRYRPTALKPLPPPLCCFPRRKPLPNGATNLKARGGGAHTPRAATDTSLADTFKSTGGDGSAEALLFKESLRLTWTEKTWHLTVGCDLPGKWILHWGVSYINDDYAIETPLKKSSEGDAFHELKIDGLYFLTCFQRQNRCLLNMKKIATSLKIPNNKLGS